jgi:hypothetical protein
VPLEAASIAVEAAKMALNPTGYLIGQLVELTSKRVAQAESERPSELSELRLAAERQELEMRIAEAQARVAQELAIARRIETAEEVEMEEFYDNSGEGYVGAKGGNGEGIAIGASGSGRKVSKRVFRFRGVAHDSGAA